MLAWASWSRFNQKSVFCFAYPVPPFSSGCPRLVFLLKLHTPPWDQLGCDYSLIVVTNAGKGSLFKDKGLPILDACIAD